MARRTPTEPTSASPRIAPPPEYDHELRETLAKTLTTDTGEPLNVFGTLARHPALLKRFNALGGLFLAHGELPARDRELVILRVAWRARSVYEWGQHAVMGRRAGLSEEEVVRATGSPDDPAWSTQDRQTLAFTDELIDRDTVGDATWQAVASRWSDAQMLELVLLIGFYRMLAGFLNAVAVQPEPDLPGWPEQAPASGAGG